MKRSKVEFRICYGSVGTFEAERYALALVHWDGQALRVAVRRPVPPSFGAAIEPLERMLSGLEELAAHRPRRIANLADFVPAHAGDGGLVSWSDVRIGHTSNPDRHFRELAESLRLRMPASQTRDERFLAWVNELGDPGGSMLAAGYSWPPARKDAMANTQFQFKSYDHGEAADCGAALVRAFRSAHVDDANDTAQWTEVILDWFADTAPVDGVVVDAHPSRRAARFHPGLKSVVPRSSPRRSATSECRVDLSHYRFRSYAHYGEHDYWHKAFDPEQNPESLLVLESEWGHAARRPSEYSARNVSRVLEDASKLFSIAARVKVVVFASNGHDERTAILEVAERMSACDYTQTREKKAPGWLWVDLPWAQWDDAHGPDAWVITDGKRVPVV